MAWNTGYSVISYVRSSLWVVPILALMAGIALKRIADTSASGWRRMMHMNCNAGFLPSILAKRIRFSIESSPSTCHVWCSGSALTRLAREARRSGWVIECAADYFMAFQASLNRFPGFNYEVQGVFQEPEDGRIRFYTYVVRE